MNAMSLEDVIAMLRSAMGDDTPVPYRIEHQGVPFDLGPIVHPMGQVMRLREWLITLDVLRTIFGDEVADQVELRTAAVRRRNPGVFAIDRHDWQAMEPEHSMDYGIAYLTDLSAANAEAAGEDDLFLGDGVNAFGNAYGLVEALSEIEDFNDVAAALAAVSLIFGIDQSMRVLNVVARRRMAAGKREADLASAQKAKARLADLRRVSNLDFAPFVA